MIMKCCFAFCGTPLVGVSSLSAVCSGSCWLPFSFVLSIFSWRISSIICCCECCRAYNTSMKVLALSMGILEWGWGLAPILLAPSAWLGCCWWGVVGLDFACEGTSLIFRVILDFGGICPWGLLSLSLPQLLVKSPTLCRGLFFCILCVRLPSVVMSPSILGKGVETSLATTHLGLVCAQIMPCLPGMCLRQAELFQGIHGRQT